MGSEQSERRSCPTAGEGDVTSDKATAHGSGYQSQSSTLAVLIHADLVPPRVSRISGLADAHRLGKDVVTPLCTYCPQRSWEHNATPLRAAGCEKHHGPPLYTEPGPILSTGPRGLGTPQSL